MELKDLVGEHVLDGVDLYDEKITDDYGYSEDCQHVTFRLDGVTYLAIEDPEDSYRSSMKEIRVITGCPIQNTFAPQKVICSHRTKGEYSGEDDILEVRSVDTGKVILEVGTENVDDYYPSFIASWRPAGFDR